ncbi:MAG TPA: hypothetical protein VG455_02795 [Acidimicrobiales bacterium]|nr:hypothetical protein [Acidimicrobiales bacterium]
MQRTRMVRLVTVNSTFHARVIAARIGAEGIVTQLRGNLDGPYPMGDVHVYVSEDDLSTATELLMADEVESAFEDDDELVESGPPVELWLVLGSMVALAAILFGRTF